MRAPHWGVTPALLAEPDDAVGLPQRVELRPDAPRHLLECYDGWRVRCTRADELGYQHPGIDVAIRELRRIAPRATALFDGSIFDVSPFTVATAPGLRVARATFNDVYRLGDVDLRDEPFDVRRALLEELATAFDPRAVSLAPLLRVIAPSPARTRRVTPTALRAITR